jgi:hypothetical protein
MPTRNSPIASSVVPTGRRMNGSEIEAMSNLVQGAGGGRRMRCFPVFRFTGVSD